MIHNIKSLVIPKSFCKTIILQGFLRKWTMPLVVMVILFLAEVQKIEVINC